MVASANQSNGFLIESSNNTIEKSVADYNLLNGFLTFSFSPLTGNTLQENVAYLNNGEGFNFGGTKGSYNNNTATLNDGNGFRLVGDDNVFLRNTAANNDSDGFYVLGSTNRLFENTASDNQGVGFLVVGSTTVNNKLVRNISIGNALHGFEVNDNTVASDNVTVANEKQGFKAAGAGATLTDNTSVFHFFPGIESTGGNSNVKGNRSYGNDTGISIGTAGNTSILSNLALGNVLDVKDQAAMCSGHTWSSNVFGSGSPACVK
jgi:parallel beta-helix repeat protein